MMEIRIYDLIFALCNIVNTYVIYNLMRIFFLVKENVPQKREILFYIGYYAIMMFFYFWVSVPIIMLLYSMISFGALSMNYQCKLRRRIFICVLIYCILFLAELLSAAITGYIHFPLNETIKYSSVAGIIINQIICLTFVNLLRSYKSKSQIDIPMAYWISIILTPIVSIAYSAKTEHSLRMSGALFR